MTRPIIWLFCCCVIVWTASRAESQEWISDYQSALNVAAATGKPVFIDSISETCDWCGKMNDEVFSKPLFRTFLQKFVAARVDLDHDESAAFRKRFPVGTLPCILIVDSSGTLLNRISGYHSAEELIAEISRIQDLLAREHANPNDWGTIQTLGQEYLRRDMSLAAEQRFSKLVQAPVSDTVRLAAYFSLAMAQYYQHENSAAVVTIRKLLETDSSGVFVEDGLLLLSQIYLDMDQRQEAEQVLTDFLKRFPNSKHAGRAREVLKRF